MVSPIDRSSVHPSKCAVMSARRCISLRVGHVNRPPYGHIVRVECNLALVRRDCLLN